MEDITWYNFFIFQKKITLVCLYHFDTCFITSMLREFKDNFDSLSSKYDSCKQFLSKSGESLDRIFGGVFLPWNISRESLFP